MLYVRFRVRRHPSWIWCPQRVLMKLSLWAGQRGQQSTWAIEGTVLSSPGWAATHCTALHEWRHGGFWVSRNQRAPSPFPVPPFLGYRILQSTIPEGKPMNSADNWKRGAKDRKINPNHSRHEDEVDPKFTTPQSIWWSRPTSFHFSQHKITVKAPKNPKSKTQGAVSSMHSNMNQKPKTVYKG